MADPQRSDPSRKSSGLRLAARRGEAREARRPSPARYIEPAADTTAVLAPDIIEVRVHIESERGLIEARRQGRQLATRAGFALTDRAIIAAIVSELGRNILLYAAPGDILVRLVEENERVGILITACDAGPGIADVGRALCDGYSTAGRLGVGLPGVRRLSDEFEIVCGPDRGTTVLVRKWRS